MSFRTDLLSGLGIPQIKVELFNSTGQTDDDIEFITRRVLRIIRPYFPVEYILRESVPFGTSGFGEGNIDVAKYKFMNVSGCYVIKSRSGTHDVLLPWSPIRIWEQVWLGKSDFLGADLLMYQNELAMLNQVTNFKFSWSFHDNKVYVTNVPSFAIGIGIVGMKPIEVIDDLDDDSIVYEYALKLGLAFGKQKIGHIWRKFAVGGMDMPGSEVVQEGKEEEATVMQTIEENSYYPGGLTF